MANEEEKRNTGYKCICGYISETSGPFLQHIGSNRRLKPDEHHESMGLIDLDTGEVIKAPGAWKDRRKHKTENQAESHQVQLQPPDFLPPFNSPADNKNTDNTVESSINNLTPQNTVESDNNQIKPAKVKNPKKSSAPTARMTDNLSHATELKFVPRVFQCNLSMILLQTINICYNVLGWPKEWTLEDILDKICFTWLQEHGIEIGYYRINESVLAAMQNHNGEEVPASEAG